MTFEKCKTGTKEVVGDTGTTEKAVKKPDTPALEEAPVLTDEDEDILSAVWDRVG
jgi:hypothetical protein